MSKDISIIGGSAAGLFTAYLLAQQGLHVRVFEASDQIDPFPRSLIITKHMWNVLGPICEKAVTNKIHRFELYADGQVATIPLRSPDLVLERSELIQGLSGHAEAAGAQILTDRHFLSLKPNGRRLTFTVSRNGDRVIESTGILVGADGAFSKVARSAGWPDRPTLPLVQAIVNLPKDMAPDTTRIWFLPEETPYFFWLIPHSPTSGALGLIGETEQGALQSLESFLEKKDLEPLEFQWGRIPKYTRWIPSHRMIRENHVYLVGDAAGHVKVSTVGGIVTGFHGALGVVEAILNGGSSRQLQTLWQELERHRLIRKVLHGFTQSDYARLLAMLNPTTKRLLSAFTRDDTGKLLWNVALRQPRLLLLGLRSLLSLVLRDVLK